MVTPCSACLLELARIIDLEIDTDDKSDPSCKCLRSRTNSSNTNPANGNASDGVVIFLILSVAEEVCAIICASLPVVIPQLFHTCKNKHSSQKTDSSYSNGLAAVPTSRSKIEGFHKLSGGSGGQTNEGRHAADEQDWASGSIQLNRVVAESCPQSQDLDDAHILVKKEYEVTV